MIGLGRRAALAGALMLLARPAWADVPERLVDAALQALAGCGQPLDLERRSALLAPWPGGPRPGLWVAAAVAKSAASADGSAADLLRVAIVERDGDGLRVLAAGEADALANEPLWSVSLDLDGGRWPLPGGTPGVGVRLGTSYNSTARSSSTTALHLFRWQGRVLHPVFAGLTQREAYDKDAAATCLARRGYAKPGADGRQAPDRVVEACDRLTDRKESWSIMPAAARQGGPGLVVRDGRGRIASRHRWSATAYAPPEFAP